MWRLSTKLDIVNNSSTDENPTHNWQYSKTNNFSNLLLEQDLVWTHSPSGSSTQINTSDKFGDRTCTDLVEASYVVSIAVCEAFHRDALKLTLAVLKCYSNLIGCCDLYRANSYILFTKVGKFGVRKRMINFLESGGLLPYVWLNEGNNQKPVPGSV